MGVSLGWSAMTEWKLHNKRAVIDSEMENQKEQKMKTKIPEGYVLIPQEAYDMLVEAAKPKKLALDAEHQKYRIENYLAGAKGKT